MESGHSRLPAPVQRNVMSGRNCAPLPAPFAAGFRHPGSALREATVIPPAWSLDHAGSQGLSHQVVSLAGLPVGNQATCIIPAWCFPAATSDRFAPSLAGSLVAV